MMLFLTNLDVNDKKLYFIDTDSSEKSPKPFTGIKDEYNYVNGERLAKQQTIPLSNYVFVYSTENRCCNGQFNPFYWNTISTLWQALGTNWNILN